MTEQRTPPEEPPVVPESAPHQDLGDERRRGNWRWVVLALALVLCSLSMVLGAAALGAYHGARDRLAAMQEAAQEHYQRGLEHRQAGELELARVEFEEALRLNPSLEEARQQLGEVLATLNAQPTPTSEARTQAVEALLAEAQTLYRAGQWEEAARRLETVRSLDPDFQPELLAELLYNTYLSAAQEMEKAGRDEEAMAFYGKALALRPDDPGVVAAQDRLALYAAALSAWGRDWEEAVRLLERLWGLDPTYRDVEPRLIRALVAAGDAYRQQGGWCLAAERYARVLLLRPDDEVQRKAEEARAACERPTSTPRPAETQAPPSAPTPEASPEATTQAAGLPTGRILFSRYDPAHDVHEILIVPAQGGEPEVVTQDASQPAVSPDGQWLAFHSWERNRLGILIAPLAGGERQKPMRTTYLEDIQPTWSPDGKRLAFGSNRHGDRKWRVYVTWVEGREEAQELVFGESPDWSRADGRIVFRGCGPTCEVWGLYVTDEQGANQTLLVADPSATAPAWSPDGRWVAFMSNRDGNWELYMVGADGLGLRRLTNGPEHDGVPAWSPDGRWIAFLSHRTGAWGVYAVPLEPGMDVRLVAMVSGEYPDWMQEQLTWIP